MHTYLAYSLWQAWQPGCVCPLIHMIIFGIDRTAFYPLPFSSLCPPPLLLSSAPSQGWMERKIECAKTSFFVLFFTMSATCNLASLVFFKCFLLSTFHLCPTVFSLHVLSFLSISPYFFLLLLSFILFLSHSIVNFNLRAGLNGTIREGSMLLIWMQHILTSV